MSDAQTYITKQQVEEAQADLAPVVAAANALQVTDEGEYTFALTVGKGCDDRIKVTEAKFDKAKKAAYAAHREVTALIASIVKPLEEARGIVTRKATQWKRAEDERARAKELERQAVERKRIEDERIALAESLAASGEIAMADKVIAEEVVVAPQAPVAVASVAGASIRENWQFEITDVRLLPRDFLTPDRIKIGGVVKAMKGETKIAGVRVFDQGTVAFRR